MTAKISVNTVRFLALISFAFLSDSDYKLHYHLSELLRRNVAGRINKNLPAAPLFYQNSFGPYLGDSVFALSASEKHMAQFEEPTFFASS